MKINGINPNKIINAYGDNKKKVESKELQKAKGTDSIEISTLGKSLKNYSLDLNPAASSEKIERIKEQIEKGTYKADGKLIAQGILEEMNLGR